jgi:hypothetical protein
MREDTHQLKLRLLQLLRPFVSVFFGIQVYARLQRLACTRKFPSFAADLAARHIILGIMRAATTARLPAVSPMTIFRPSLGPVLE